MSDYEPTPLEADPIRLNDLMAVVDHAFKQVRPAVNALPSVPADGHCAECGSDDLYFYEPGYLRYVRLDFDDGDIWATTHGWDDMSENGEFDLVVCLNCDTAYRTPDDLNWN